MRRFCLFVLFWLAAAAAFGQAAGEGAGGAAADEGKEPAFVLLDDSIEPEITIRRGETHTLEEYRINGRLYKVRVIPTHGVPYILIDPRGDGSFIPWDGPAGPGLSVPQWVVVTF